MFVQFGDWIYASWNFFLCLQFARVGPLPTVTKYAPRTGLADNRDI